MYQKCCCNLHPAWLQGATCTSWLRVRTPTYRFVKYGNFANFATRNKHVPEIERQHRVIKERVRASRSTLPFEVLPRLRLVEMVNNCALWINMFPAKGGISNVSPRTLMTRIKLDYSNNCRLPLWSYVQVHNDPNPKNSPTARTIGAITLGPTGNLQGG